MGIHFGDQSCLALAGLENRPRWSTPDLEFSPKDLLSGIVLLGGTCSTGVIPSSGVSIEGSGFFQDTGLRKRKDKVRTVCLIISLSACKALCG